MRKSDPLEQIYISKAFDGAIFVRNCITQFEILVATSKQKFLRMGKSQKAISLNQFLGC